jgi:hypothetical protein
LPLSLERPQRVETETFAVQCFLSDQVRKYRVEQAHSLAFSGNWLPLYSLLLAPDKAVLLFAGT